ncbi:MAG: tRNA dihydrouridine synthase DusB [Chloroflexi bacterium]|nr:tRNA dihydrouridine synthase DusB [Chloroflexota bacterium]|tara:strand:+ start:8222 stop:9196 length:975 start_codon:yes stop_codon:yes gene_type:complete
MVMEKLLYKNKIRLAPMASITNAPFRQICIECGSGYVTTEEIDSESLVKNKSEKTKKIIEYYPEEKPIAMQLLGNDANYLSEASKILQDIGADIIDINMGCPVPKITKKGKGVALMKDINKTAKLINHIRKNTILPLTVKIRSGWDQNNLNALEFSKMLEQEGVDAITIHPRSRLQQFTGMSKWEIISEIVSSVRIPITGSGDVRSLSSAKSMMKKTLCNSVMIGRGSIGNPWIFNQQYLNLNDMQRETYKKNIIIKHIELIRNFFHENQLDMQMKKQLSFYAKGFKNAREFRNNLFNSKEEINDLISSFFIEWEKNSKIMVQI